MKNIRSTITEITTVTERLLKQVQCLNISMTTGFVGEIIAQYGKLCNSMPNLVAFLIITTVIQ
jgi:hypothetical protein